MTVVGWSREPQRLSVNSGLGFSHKWKQPNLSIPLASRGLSSAEGAHFRVKTPKPPFGEARLTRQSYRHHKKSGRRNPPRPPHNLSQQSPNPTSSCSGESPYGNRVFAGCSSSPMPSIGGESSNMTPRFAAYAASHADMMYAPAQDQTNTYSSTSGITCLDTLRTPPHPRRTTRSPASLGSNKYSFLTFATTMASAYSTSDM